MKAGAPVDSTIKGLLEFMEEGDIIIDGGNEWCASESSESCCEAQTAGLWPPGRETLRPAETQLSTRKFFSAHASM